MSQWRNWSGSVTAAPARFARPRDEGELAALLDGSGQVRCVGAGHSFMPLCETPGTLIALDLMQGELRIAADRRSVWLPAGWSLARATAQLWEHGLSLINQGDVNPQSVAGAIGTGTHGTGAQLGCLSSAVEGVRLMLMDGTVLECDDDNRPDLFAAARLSLGLVGVVLAVRMAVIPAYFLEERVEKRPLDAVLEAWDDLSATNRHVEFWVFPYCDDVILKRLNLAEPGTSGLNRGDVDETAFRWGCRASRAFPGAIPMLQRAMMRFVGDEDPRCGPAWQVFPQDRTIRFEEMEYEVPAADGIAALRAVLAEIRRARLPIAFPLEFRSVASDDVWLSPFSAGAALSISVHQYAPMPWRAQFARIESVLRGFGGRPHWGKRHTLDAEALEPLYPRMADFLRVRAEVDPQAMLANDAMRHLFAIAPT